MVTSAISENGKSTKKTEKTTNRIAKQTKQLELQQLNTKIIQFHLTGTSPLVCHNFGPKERLRMLEQQMGKSKSPVREARSPEEEYLNCFYWVDQSEPLEPDYIDESGVRRYEEERVRRLISESRLGFPVTAFKQAMVAAARNTSLKMVSLKQQIFVTSPDHHEYAIIEGEPQMDNRIVRIGRRQPMERFRPIWVDWGTVIRVSFDANSLNSEMVANLLSIAGFYVGVGEGRPEKSSLGWGRFRITKSN